MRDIATKADNTTTLSASDWNSNQAELENAVTTSDQTLDPAGGADTDLNMLGQAMAGYAGASWGYDESGTANAHVVGIGSNLKPVSKYYKNMVVAYLPGNTNTSTAVTVNVSSLGAKAIRMPGGNVPIIGAFSPFRMLVLKYNDSAGYFEVVAGGGNPAIRFANEPGFAGVNAVVTDIGASAETTLIVNDSQTLTANLDITDNINVRVLRGGEFVKASTYTLNIESLTTGIYQIFSGFSPGDVTVGSNTEAFPQWWGAVGDGTTDDAIPIQAAIDMAINQSGGTVRFPAGQYAITSTLDVHYVGEGVDPGGIRRIGGVRLVGVVGPGNDSIFEGDTVASIIKKSGAAGGILDYSSTWHCVTEHLQLINKSASAEYIVRVRSFDSPVFSNVHHTWNNVVFIDDATVTGVQVIIRDSQHLVFNQCGWPTGDSPVLRIGENTGVNSTLMNGDTHSIRFSQCTFAGDTYVRQTRGLVFDQSEWFAVKNGGGEGSRVIPEGDQLAQNVALMNCKAAFAGDDTLTFYTQGTSGNSLLVLGGVYSGYQTAFDLNGDGPTLFLGPIFSQIGGTGVDVRIDGSNIGAVSIQADHDGTRGAGNTAVDDNRTMPKKPFVFLNNLSSDHTYANVGNYESIISSNVQLRGGLYKLNWALTIASANTTGYRGRLSVDGTIVVGTVATAFVTNGEIQTLMFSTVIKLDATTAAVPIQLQSRQAAGTASTIKAPATSTGTSHIILEEL